MALFDNIQQMMKKNSSPNVAAGVNQNVNQAQGQVANNVNQATQGIGQAFQYNQQNMQNNINQGNWSNLQNQLNTQYKGPQAGSVNVGSQQQNMANQQANLLGSTSGQQQLLKQQYGNHQNYNNGEQRLDTMLQAGNNNFQKQAAQAKTQGQQLNNNVNQQNMAQNMNAATTQDQTQKGVSNLRQGMGDTSQGIYSNAQQLAATDNAQDLATQQKMMDIKNKIAGGKIDSNTLQQLGLNPDSITYGVNVGDFINSQGGGANVGNVISKDDFSKFKNINQLLGNDTAGLDENNAGTYQKGSMGFDQAGLQKSLADAKQKYEGSFAAQKDKLAGAQSLLKQLQNANQIGDYQTKNQAWLNIARGYGLDTSGGIYRNLEWAEKDNLAKAQSAYNQAKTQADSQYLTKLGVEDT